MRVDMKVWSACACMVRCSKGKRHTQYNNELLRCPAAGGIVEMLRRLCATKGAIAPPRFRYDTSSRAREQVLDRGTTCKARVRD